eukprot:jgi/Psemu1/283086/fgenesh1_pg.19_\
MKHRSKWKEKTVTRRKKTVNGPEETMDGLKESVKRKKIIIAALKLELSERDLEVAPGEKEREKLRELKDREIAWKQRLMEDLHDLLSNKVNQEGALIKSLMDERDQIETQLNAASNELRQERERIAYQSNELANAQELVKQMDEECNRMEGKMALSIRERRQNIIMIKSLKDRIDQIKEERHGCTNYSRQEREISQQESNKFATSQTPVHHNMEVVEEMAQDKAKIKVQEKMFKEEDDREIALKQKEMGDLRGSGLNKPIQKRGFDDRREQELIKQVEEQKTKIKMKNDQIKL